jgi:hypothetical protein
MHPSLRPAGNWVSMHPSLSTCIREVVTAHTQCVWPSSAPPLAAPVRTSQSLTVLSYDADAISDPSGENEIAVTGSLWPSSAVIPFQRYGICVLASKVVSAA